MPEDKADWISALEALRLVQKLLDESDADAASTLVRWAAGAFVATRCRLLRRWDDDDASNVTAIWHSDIREQFWHQYGELDQAAGSNWKVGDFKISCYHQREWRNTQLLGVEFRESQIREAAPKLEPNASERPEPFDDLPAPNSGTKQGRRGARRKDWWDHLWIAMIRRIRSDTLNPSTVGELQTILEDYAENVLGENVGDSTLKPMASNLFKYLGESGGKLGEG